MMKPLVACVAPFALATGTGSVAQTVYMGQISTATLSGMLGLRDLPE